jgi:hypothetical protein
MNEKLARFVNYAIWVFSEYKKLSDPELNNGQIKVVDSKICQKTGSTLFTIQFFGKNVFPIISAKELAEDNEVLLKFSKSDVKTIVEAAKNDEARISRASEKTVDSVVFDPDKKTRFFTFAVKRGDRTETKRYSAEEIYSDKDFLLNLYKTSIADVSYEAGKNSLDLNIPG